MDDDNQTSEGRYDRDLLLAQIRELYGRVAYTHKTHEKQADICSEADKHQRRIKIFLTALSSGAFLASVAGLLLDKEWAAVATSFIAILVSASSLSDKTFKHGEEMQQHRDTAAKLWNLRESYLSLIVDLEGRALSVGEGRLRRDRLQEIAEKVYADAPRTSAKAYTRAQDGLQNREDLTFSEREIDLLLPKQLRKENETNDVSGK